MGLSVSKVCGLGHCFGASGFKGDDAIHIDTKVPSRKHRAHVETGRPGSKNDTEAELTIEFTGKKAMKNTNTNGK